MRLDEFQTQMNRLVAVFGRPFDWNEGSEMEYYKALRSLPSSDFARAVGKAITAFVPTSAERIPSPAQLRAFAGGEATVDPGRSTRPADCPSCCGGIRFDGTGYCACVSGAWRQSKAEQIRKLRQKRGARILRDRERELSPVGPELDNVYRDMRVPF